MPKKCEYCERPYENLTIMNGDQRLYAWITAIISAGILGLSVVGYKACNADKAQPDQIRIEQIRADTAEKVATLQSQSAERQAKITADAKTEADVTKAYNDKKFEADISFNKAELAKAEAKKMELTKEDPKEVSRREIYKACIAAKNDPALCNGSVQTVRCLEPNK